MVQAFGSDRLDRAQRYSVRFEGRHAMCFDPQSGRRIRE
ncbi:ABC transporter ATP-binding protein [Bordetella pertussis]|nr:ABC transporter ATP-binding protein [Bordetella pertussis]